LVLEREANAASHHAEIVVVSKVPADIADPTDVPGEAHLQSVPDLAGGCSMVVGLVAKAFQYPNQDVVVMVPVKNPPPPAKM
jgi:hypothetical protein